MTEGVTANLTTLILASDVKQNRNRLWCLDFIGVKNHPIRMQVMQEVVESGKQVVDGNFELNSVVLMLLWAGVSMGKIECWL